MVTEDRTLPLRVLNSTGTQGLAAAAAEVLGDGGWQVAEVGNYEGDEIPTAVLYPETADDPEAAAVAAATAAAVAADLGDGRADAHRGRRRHHRRARPRLRALSRPRRAPASAPRARARPPGARTGARR